ncbi:hypothetical protein A0H81_07239 [Grifola frondosa]|uniref:Uncharacterized protein n=1 Tax=Grifola frondosa TaxID=5627 RepID=A0A1C7MAC4_GRIFR|nr:hypothetical protein A0H81_07239 [Grifola frondosa]
MDLDVYTPYTRFPEMVAYLTGVEGFIRDPEADEHFYDVDGVAEIARLKKDTIGIDVVGDKQKPRFTRCLFSG